MVALWEKQHRKGLALVQVKELVQNLSKTLDAEKQFSGLTGRLLELSSMCGGLRDWGGALCLPNQQSTTPEDLEQGLVKERTWPLAFGYSHLHTSGCTHQSWLEDQVVTRGHHASKRHGYLR